MGVLSIDPGANKSGFAFTDRLRIARSALDPIRTNGDDHALIEHVAELVGTRDVSILLVGVALDQDGGETERSTASRVLAKQLGERLPALAVCTHDERLTTKEAESRLRDLGYSGREIKVRKDSWAALVLLEDWIASGEPR